MEALAPLPREEKEMEEMTLIEAIRQANDAGYEVFVSTEDEPQEGAWLPDLINEAQLDADLYDRQWSEPVLVRHNDDGTREVFFEVDDFTRKPYGTFYNTDTHALYLVTLEESSGAIIEQGTVWALHPMDALLAYSADHGWKPERDTLDHFPNMDYWEMIESDGTRIVVEEATAF